MLLKLIQDENVVNIPVYNTDEVVCVIAPFKELVSGIEVYDNGLIATYDEFRKWSDDHILTEGTTKVWVK